MSFILKKVLENLLFGYGRLTHEDLKLTHGVGDNQTPAATVEALEFELAEERAKFMRLEQEHQRAKAEIGTLTRAKKAKAAESLAAIAHAQQLSARLSVTDRLLLERTKELGAAQVFLTRVDAVSEAELVGMVDSLNTLISSASGALSAAWDQVDPVPGMQVEDLDLKQICDNLGNPVLEQIAGRNSVVIALAVQMHLCHFIERVTSGWGSGQLAGTLSEIHGMISAKESQTIASRWRILTKRYIPSQELPQSEEIVIGLARILLVTRSFVNFSEAKALVAISAGTEIEGVTEATVQLDDTIKTKIASSDVSVIVVPPGAIFTKETMTDEFGQEGEHQVVAGTTEIGLLQRSGSTEKVLRKPKVILERDLVETEAKV